MPKQQLVKLIRSGMEDLAHKHRATVYCATNRGNLHLIPVKTIDHRRIPEKILTPSSMYEKICVHKPSVEVGLGAPSRPLHDTLRLGYARNSSLGFSYEQAIHRT